MRFAAQSRRPAGGAPGIELQVYDLDRWHHALERRFGKGRFYVELRDEAEERSSQQNRYWWGVIVKAVREQWIREGVQIVTESGVEMPIPKEQVHDALVTAFGGGMVRTPLGRARKGSSSMSVEEFGHLIEVTSEWWHDRYKSTFPAPGESP